VTRSVTGLAGSLDVTSRGDSTEGQLISEREIFIAALNERGERASSQRERERGKIERSKGRKDRRRKKREGAREKRERKLKSGFSMVQDLRSIFW
jgi:hypothetical protein